MEDFLPKRNVYLSEINRLEEEMKEVSESEKKETLKIQAGTLYDGYNKIKEKVLFSPEMLEILSYYLNASTVQNFKEDLMQELLMQTSDVLDKFDEKHDIKAFPNYLRKFLSAKREGCMLAMTSGIPRSAKYNMLKTGKYKENINSLTNAMSLEKKINQDEDTTVLDILADENSNSKRRITELVKLITYDFPEFDKMVFADSFNHLDPKSIAKLRGTSEYLVKKALKNCVEKIQKDENLLFYASELQKIV